MTLVAELRHKKRRITVETGTFERVDQICRRWCNKLNKNAVLKRYENGAKPAIVVARYYHDGERLIVEDATQDQSDTAWVHSGQAQETRTDRPKGQAGSAPASDLSGRMPQADG